MERRHKENENVDETACDLSTPCTRHRAGARASGPRTPSSAAVTNVYRASRDLFLAQRFARHVSPLTTTIYTSPSDQEMREKVRWLSC
jgi:hypothetical protein